jgi:hypothetical protein
MVGNMHFWPTHPRIFNSSPLVLDVLLKRLVIESPLFVLTDNKEQSAGR